MAASAVPTVQKTGLALGAAASGLLANASGFSSVMTEADFERAAFWIPACFVIAASFAWLASFKLIRQQAAG